MIEKKINKLPEFPGCYLFSNSNQEIIYIGKAKNIKNRVRQYFVVSDNVRLSKLREEIFNIDFIVTSNEKEALLLESNLIKKNKPKYNVLLKDDKKYPYVKLVRNNSLKLSIARDLKDKSAYYFGPFPNSTSAYESIELLNYYLPLQKCSRLPKELCFYYDLGLCMGFCVHDIKENSKDILVEEIKSFYEGNTTKIKKDLISKMNLASSEQRYEDALVYRKLIENLKELEINQTIDLKNNLNVDVFGYYYDELNKIIFISILIYRFGNLIAKKKYQYHVNFNLDETFSSFLYNYYELNLLPQNIYLSKELSNKLILELYGNKIFSPQKGDKYKILQLANKNSYEDYLFSQNKNKSYLDGINELQKLLEIKNISNIEAYDVSHFQGENVVGVKINIINNDFIKNNYRKYILDNDNKDDLDNTYQLLYRRFYNLIQNDELIPDLVILDGGINQLNLINKINNELNLKINAIGLKKDDKHTTKSIVLLNSKEIILDKKSNLYKLMYRVQEEVHRYAYSFHSSKSISGINKSLLNIKGVGVKSEKKLITKFKTIENIKKASFEEIEKTIGKNIARIIKEELNK